ncbi:MAG: hypothetical protein ACO3EG_07490 [Chitinophagaceae bacterium]
MNVYHYNLNIPVPFLPKGMDMRGNISGVYKKIFAKNLINDEFLSWLDFLKLDLEEGRILHMKTNRHSQYPVHVDSPNDSINRVNINMIYDSVDADMKWYQGDKETETFTANKLVRSYTKYKEIYSVKCNAPALVNTGIPHRVVLSSRQIKPRHCFILCLIHKGTKERVSFQDAKEILSPFFHNPPTAP